jgi:Eukaryotic DNA topoisomerase I, catalytic core
MDLRASEWPSAGDRTRCPRAQAASVSSRLDLGANIAKYDTMIAFAITLPEIRKRVHADLKKRALSRDHVLATVVTLLEKTLIRIGNKEYARANNSFGLTTLLDEDGARQCIDSESRSLASARARGAPTVRQRKRRCWRC